MPEVEAILVIAREITVTGLMALMVVALAQGWVVTRWHYDEMQRMHEERYVRLQNNLLDR